MLLPGSLYIAQDVQMSMGLSNTLCCVDGLETRVPNLPGNDGRTDSYPNLPTGASADPVAIFSNPNKSTS